VREKNLEDDSGEGLGDWVKKENGYIYCIGQTVIKLLIKFKRSKIIHKKMSELLNKIIFKTSFKTIKQ
jgi:hypothetical protein